MRAAGHDRRIPKDSNVNLVDVDAVDPVNAALEHFPEHGSPITPGQLAVRLKMTSEHATRALAVLGLTSDGPTQPVPTVNGHRPRKANR